MDATKIGIYTASLKADQQISEAGRLWRLGLDTVEIARHLGVYEHQAVYLAARGRRP